MLTEYKINVKPVDLVEKNLYYSSKSSRELETMNLIADLKSGVIIDTFHEYNINYRLKLLMSAAYGND